MEDCLIKSRRSALRLAMCKKDGYAIAQHFGPTRALERVLN